ncbi:IclR family transcriptional regulator C-terminal domain-containing protein [Alloyangia pacifica]|uniref:IclR family transcriptional regulator domain-containing protein n=1 Tax=Alloyangia pacifica TaxID=311180 RepID=UPI001CFE3644|nr:IclR family transcriptional regulator C-terminal domain-containing protein [Alloyangia pacifica]
MAQANDQILSSAQPGTVYSVTGTATGRLFAALTNEAEARAIAALQMAEGAPQRYVGACPPFDEILAPLETVRRTGVSITYSFPQPGVTAIAAPVYNFSDELELAVTMIGAAEEIDISLDGDHVAPLRALAATISRKLGYFANASGA